MTVAVIVLACIGASVVLGLALGRVMRRMGE
jgi:hypothetical protein